MSVRELKALLEQFPDDAGVQFEDATFKRLCEITGHRYCEPGSHHRAQRRGLVLLSNSVESFR